MTGGRAPRQKGNRLERTIVRLLKDAVLGAERVPLSGSAGGSYCGDISAPLLGSDRTIECNARKDGFRELYIWLDGRDALIIRARPARAACRPSLFGEPNQKVSKAGRSYASALSRFATAMQGNGFASRSFRKARRLNSCGFPTATRLVCKDH
jgi:hypothetical protein